MAVEPYLPTWIAHDTGVARLEEAAASLSTETHAMPRYFFHIEAAGSRARDIDGTTLNSPSTARAEAIRLLGACMRDKPGVLDDGRDFRVEVTDSADLVLFTIIALAIDAPVCASMRG